MQTRLLLLLALAVPLALSGCADDLASGVAPGVAPPEASGKLRHGHLLGSATRASGAELGADAVAMGKDGDDDEYVGLIVSLDPYRVFERYGEMDPYRVFERYRVFNRYRVFERYEYEHVFAGAAVWVAEDDLDGLVETMEADAAVVWVEPDVEMSLSPLGLTAHSGSDSETLPWSVAEIGAGGGSASGVDLYVADTGVSSSDVDERGGRDFSEEAGTSTDGRDRDGHGTHIAGIAAAKANGAGIRGVAPGMRVYDLRVLTGKEADDDEPVDLSSAIAAVEHATGARLANPTRPAVLNFSLGTDVGTADYNALDDAVEAAVDAGVVVVVAAGNSAQDVSTISPAHARGAITVGAYDQAGRFASFSNRGAGVDLLAPGVDIVSSKPEDPRGLAVMSGTSMAAAHVSGAAALFLQANPQATPAQVEAALVGSARPLATGVPAGTTNRTLWVGDGGALDVPVPPFFDYALYGGELVEMRGRVRAAAAAGNASVFAREIKAGEDTRVDGFGYYTEKLSGSSRAFRPAVNPTGLPGAQRALPLAFDAAAVSASRLADRVTRTTWGDLHVRGGLRLGTEAQPAVWRVTGNFKLEEGAYVSGHGVLIVEGNVEIRESLRVAPGSALAILGAKEVKVEADNLHLAATLFGAKKVEVKGSAQITGGLVSLGVTRLEGEISLDKAPLAPSLARALWGR